MWRVENFYFHKYNFLSSDTEMDKKGNIVTINTKYLTFINTCTIIFLKIIKIINKKIN